MAPPTFSAGRAGAFGFAITAVKRSFLPGVCAAMWLLGGLGSTAAEPELRPEDLPHFPAVEPAAAINTFEVRPGFRLELAAHEPEVMDPIAVSFDERGRLYVVEMRDYSERRPEKLGRIRRLEDRDGDGYYETSTVFLESLAWPTAVTCWGDGVFIGATPDIYYARDTDGDGKADVRELVFTGFASDFAPYATNKLNVQAMFNSFQWGVDGRIHGCASLSGGKVQRAESSWVREWLGRAGVKDGANPPVDMRGHDFSFDPRTLELRTETGGGQYGMTFDDAGRKFLCSNSDHLQWVTYEDRHAGRNPWVNLPTPRESIAIDGPAAEVFRISPDEPWRVIRTRWRVTGLVPGLVEGGGRASGYFTSATGLTIYRGDVYGVDYAGDAFVADCGSNLIHRKKLRQRNDDWLGERAADETKREFLASRDTWFRPVQFANAPDGCLWMIDMYREIIEHPWSLPPGIKRLLDLNSGNDRGRLYRIVPTATAQGPLRRRVNLAEASTTDLITALAHANGWHRDTAQRLLVERQDRTAVPRLREILRAQEAATALAHLPALYVLENLRALEDEDLVVAMQDASEAVRRHAVRLVGWRFDARTIAAASLPAAVGAQLARRATDAAAEVRLETAFTLGLVSLPQRVPLLARMLVDTSADEGRVHTLIRAAALAAANDDIAEVFREVTRLAADHPASAQIIEILGRRHRDAELNLAFEVLTARAQDPAALRLAVSLGDGLRRAGTTLAAVDARERLKPLQVVARRVAGDAQSPRQLEALRFLGLLPADASRESLLAALAKGQSAAAQRVAVEELLRADAAEVSDQVFQRWEALAPEPRTAAIDALLRRATGAARVLDALTARQAVPADLTAAQVAALRAHADAAVKERAIALLGAPAASRNEALARALPALNLKGDARRGRDVVAAQCAPCHRLGGQGNALGPDLESIRSQPKEKLLVAIIDPNREVQPNYLAVTVETKDHEEHTGMLASDTAAGLTLRQAGGVLTTIPRDQVARFKPEGRSLMPEGFESTLTLPQLADLLECLTTSAP